MFSPLQNINVAYATDVLVVRGENEWKLFMSPEVRLRQDVYNLIYYSERPITQPKF